MAMCLRGRSLGDARGATRLSARSLLATLAWRCTLASLAPLGGAPSNARPRCSPGGAPRRSLSAMLAAGRRCSLGDAALDRSLRDARWALRLHALALGAHSAMRPPKALFVGEARQLALLARPRALVRSFGGARLAVLVGDALVCARGCSLDDAPYGRSRDDASSGRSLGDARWAMHSLGNARFVTLFVGATLAWRRSMHDASFLGDTRVATLAS